MAKFYGQVGYVSTMAESAPGVHEEVIVERPYYGDVLKKSRRLENGYSVNDNVQINNSISILADAYAYQNFANIRYVKWMGTAWKVSEAEVQPPRITLSLGGVWNGQQG